MARLRPVDEVEVFLMAGKPPVEALDESVSESTESYVGYIDGNPEAVFGVGPFPGMPDVGMPWMVGTEVLAKEYRQWLPIATQLVDRLNDRYPILTNFCLKSNTKAIRWLKFMGFQFIDEEVSGLPNFVQFVRYR